MHKYSEDQAANARYKVFLSVDAQGPLSYLQQNMLLQKHSLQMPAKPQIFQDTN